MAVEKFYGLKRPASTDEEDGGPSITGSLPALAPASSESCRSSSSSGKPSTSCLLRLGTKKRLFEPETVYKIFPRQQKAIEFSRNSIQNIAVFAYESEEFGREGQRRYVATTYYEFGRRYLTKKCTKHFYEVIVEGTACRLYFDIEFKRKFNPNTDALFLLEIFIEYVCYQLHSMYHVTCNRSNIVDLDSSTPEKFSRHLVFHIPSAIFRNNVLVGQFVRCICDQLRSFNHLVEQGNEKEEAYAQIYTSLTRRDKRGPLCPSAERLLHLFVKDKEGRKALICDEAVYTRNRNFRLYLSSKLGKSAAVLKVAKESKFKSSYSESVTRRRWSKQFNTLMDSLVCNVSFQTSPQMKILPTDTSHVSKEMSSKHRDCSHSVRGDSSRTEAMREDSETGFSHSPFPLVDSFITSTLTKGGVQGSIRRWTYFPEGKSVLYDIQHNRWCENVGRAHKSNNIIIVADLTNGVYYQKCHDPDCRRINFRSNEKSIPLEYNPVLQQAEEQKNQLISSKDESQELESYVSDLSQREIEQFEEDDSVDMLLDEREHSNSSSEPAFLLADVSLEEIEQFEELDSTNHSAVECTQKQKPSSNVLLDGANVPLEQLLSEETAAAVGHARSPSPNEDDSKIDAIMMEALQDYESHLSPRSCW